jgi:hypothetical protein
MQHLFSLLVLLVLSLGLAACSKSDTGPNGASSASAAPTQLNWDQGSWNQTNWQ